MDIEMIIEHPQEGKAFVPVVEEGITWTTGRTGTPGQLDFTVIKDNIINFQEGNRVQLKIDGTPVFLGFVFKKSRNKDGLIKVTAYDQLRYFKNKDIYIYENKTASELLKMIAGDFSLFTGDIEDTKYNIELRIEDNETLFDIMGNALDLTLYNTKEMYVLYDDFGKLTLKNIGSMKVPLMITESSAEDYDYETSIDSDVYNKVKIVYEDSGTKEREVFVSKSDENIKKWGVLQFYETVDDRQKGQATAEAVLELYNHKKRALSINNVIGDLRVRAGCMLPIFLNLGDIVTSTWLIVEKCRHSFNDNEHTMDLTLIGGEFSA